jgi:hypothetical protein
MQDVAQQALDVLRQEENDPMLHSQYHHFLSRPYEGIDSMLLSTRNSDLVGCLKDQVRLTHAWNKELDLTRSGTLGMTSLGFYGKE